MRLVLAGFLAAVATVIALSVGLRGPAYERHGARALGRLPFPFSFPDNLLTLPLCLALGYLMKGGVLLHTHHAASYWMGIASLATVPILVAESVALLGWIRTLPHHLQLPADSALLGSHWRCLMRCCTWQGLLLIPPSTQHIVSVAPWLLVLPEGFLHSAASGFSFMALIQSPPCAGFVIHLCGFRRRTGACPNVTGSSATRVISRTRSAPLSIV